MKFLVKSLISILIPILCPTLVFAEPGASAPTTQVGAAIQREGISFSLRLLPRSFIPDRKLVGLLEIANTRASDTIVISSVNIVAGGNISEIYNEATSVTESEQEIAPLAKREYKVVFNRNRKPTLVERMNFRTGQNDFLTTVTYFTLDESNRRHLTMVLSAPIETTREYVLYGGVCGGMLLIIFMISSKILNAAKDNHLKNVAQNVGPLTLKWTSMLFAYGVNGLVIATLLLLLSSGINNLSLPISFQLQDFTGGVLVGLFSVVLGKYLAEKLSII